MAHRDFDSTLGPRPGEEAHGPWILAVSVLGQPKGINGCTDASNAALFGVMPTAGTSMLSRIDADAAGRTGRPRLTPPGDGSRRCSPPLPPLEPDATPLHEIIFEVMEPPADVRMPGMDEEAVGMQDAALRASAHGTATELLERTTEGALLLRALASPATETMTRIPGKAADRVATVLRDALRRAVDSQLANVKKPTVAGRAEAAKARRWLWVSPTLLLRAPSSGELANETMKVASARKRETIVTDRVKLIETDHAVDLLETYVAELENPPCHQDRNMLPAWTDT